MAIKKSELYSRIWASCDELRGGMDASQYKDYVLVLLFIKYISDKYAGVPYAPITIPEGSSFKDMVALKGKSDIGDQINKRIIAPLATANQLSDMPDFNDTTKLGSGKEIVERLTNLIAIFEDKALDFSKNRTEGDDLLGDAYEFLMRHFATESGKSKGQFYTPAEVSRIMARIVGIHNDQTTANTTVYDPTCGSGSLLLKVADEARGPVTLYGQEKDAATSGLARMNMILHNNPTALIRQGNTLADPKFTTEEGHLKMFDYVVANPPFSDKRWRTGIDPLHDPYERFQAYGVPPAKQGDFAYLLHIIRSLKATGTGACILPHGVLSRGNAEADIRRNLVKRGYIAGIIGLPPNLFYGTGIPACIIVIDKRDAATREGIFMIDASRGYLKDGNKNRLRSQDIHKIVDVFNRRLEVPGYSRMVSIEEIEKKNSFNLNIPRYIDSQQAEDVQDIEAHLRGGIPESDINAFDAHWKVSPLLRHALFKPNRPGYLDLAINKDAIKSTIYEHPEFVAYIHSMNALYADWQQCAAAMLKSLTPGSHPKEVIDNLSESLLANFAGAPLIDNYDVYQHLMDYWAETMQDDCYLIAADGWKAQTYRIGQPNNKGKDKGWACDLVPKCLIVARYFLTEQENITRLEGELGRVTAEIAALEEEHGGDEGIFAAFEKVNKGAVNARLKEVTGLFSTDEDSAEEAEVLRAWLNLTTQEAKWKTALKDAEATLDAAAYAKYPTLIENEIKSLVVDDKWLAAVAADIQGELDRITRSLTRRVRELADRYEMPLPQATSQAAELEQVMRSNLENMGFLQDLVTGKTRLPGFSQEWETVRLRGLLRYERPDKYIVQDTDYHEYGGIPVLTANKSFILGYTDEDFGICRDLPAIVFDDFTTDSKYVDMPFKVKSSAIKILRSKHERINLRFVFERMRLINFPHGDHKRYYISEYQDIELAVPDYEEQCAIAAVLADMDAEIAALGQKLLKVRQLKQGMMYNLLSGKIRLA